MLICLAASLMVLYKSFVSLIISTIDLKLSPNGTMPSSSTKAISINLLKDSFILIIEMIIFLPSLINLTKATTFDM